MNICVVGAGYVGLVTGAVFERMRRLGFEYYSIGRQPVLRT